MSDSSIQQAAEVLRQYLTGRVSHTTAQARVRRLGHDLKDLGVTDELRRREDAERAEAEAAAAARRRHDQQVITYIRKEHERTKGITIDGF
jgi:hypothetical protein